MPFDTSSAISARGTRDARDADVALAVHEINRRAIVIAAAMTFERSEIEHHSVQARARPLPAQVERAIAAHPVGTKGRRIESWTARIHGGDRARVTIGIQALIDSGKQAWSDEYRFRRRDGSYAYVFDRGLVLREASRKPIRASAWRSSAL